MGDLIFVVDRKGISFSMILLGELDEGQCNLGMGH